MNFVQPIRDPEKIEQFKRMLKAQNKRNYLIFVIGINTGLRVGDIVKLRVKDVRGEHISIREQKTGKEKKVKITPQLRRDLKEMLKGRNGEEYIIKSREGKNKHLSRTQVYRILRKVADKLDLDSIGTHTLRKTFGYHFYKKTHDVAMLQDLFNHSSPAITLRYIGINQDMRDKAMENFKI